MKFGRFGCPLSPLVSLYGHHGWIFSFKFHCFKSRFPIGSFLPKIKIFSRWYFFGGPVPFHQSIWFVRSSFSRCFGGLGQACERFWPKSSHPVDLPYCCCQPRSHASSRRSRLVKWCVLVNRVNPQNAYLSYMYVNSSVCRWLYSVQPARWWGPAPYASVPLDVWHGRWTLDWLPHPLILLRYFQHSRLYFYTFF